MPANTHDSDIPAQRGRGAPAVVGRYALPRVVAVVSDGSAGLPADTRAVFLTHTDPARARTAQQAMREAGGPPVVTDADTTAISLAAALLTALAHAGRTPAITSAVLRVLVQRSRRNVPMCRTNKNRVRRPRHEAA